jgi:hypothetical protein
VRLLNSTSSEAGGAFVFGLAALTSIMLLNQIAKRFGAGGQGSCGRDREVFLLSLPFIVAMTLDGGAPRGALRVQPPRRR